MSKMTVIGSSGPMLARGAREVPPEAPELAADRATTPPAARPGRQGGRPRGRAMIVQARSRLAVNLRIFGRVPISPAHPKT